LAVRSLRRKKQFYRQLNNNATGFSAHNKITRETTPFLTSHLTVENSEEFNLFKISNSL
jgi:hypothetical protein